MKTWSPRESIAAAGVNFADVEVTIAQAFEDIPITSKEWDDFVLSVRGDIYVTFDWCRIWWRHYGRGRTLRVFVFRRNGQLVGLAPMFIERVWLGLINVKIGKRVGADFALTIFALPLSPSVVEIAYRQMVSYLIEHERCDAVWIGVTPGDDPTLSGLRMACEALPNLVRIVQDAEKGPHTVFRLPEKFETYLAGLERRQRQNYRRQLKLFKNGFNVSSETVKDPVPAREAFGNFRLDHARQWAAEGKAGQFGDWPCAAEFNSDLVENLSQSERFRMVRLHANGKNVSSQYAFVFGDRCYWRLPARSTESEFEHFGLGVLGMVQLIEEMIKEGVHEIEAGVGHYDYKLRFGGEERRVRCVLIESRRPGVALQVGLFLKLSELLHLAYYRIWFSRMAPRLPFRRQPLWRAWIRSRL
jgi:CelD/BcsL family acetyltransferase involved in cellulose biosynthesis